MKIYKMESSNIDPFMFRQGLITTGSMCLSILIIFVILGAFSDFTVPFILISKIWGYILFFLFIIFLLGYSSRNIYLARRFVIDDDSFVRFQESESTNGWTAYNLRKLERKSGQRINEIIPFNEVKSINVKKYGIYIKSKNYNHFNGNGRIIIPKETSDYHEIVDRVSQIAKSIGMVQD